MTQLPSAEAGVWTEVWLSLETKLLTPGGIASPLQPPQCNLGAWHSAGHHTCVVLASCVQGSRNMALVHLCKLFIASTIVSLAWPAGNSCSLVFSLVPRKWDSFDRDAPGKDLDNHSVELLRPSRVNNEGRSDRGRGSSWWAGPGFPSPALCTHGLLESASPGILRLCHRFSFLFFLAARGLSVELGIQALRQGTVRLPLWEAESQLGLGLWVSHLELLPGLPQAEVPTDACQWQRKLEVTWSCKKSCES